jgi:anti-sigma factor RsiW
MNNELKNILSNSNKDIDNQKLMDYLSGKLSAEEKHEIEKQMAESDFVNDAVEGLQDIKNKKDVSQYVDQLNDNLHKQLDKKKKRKQKRALKYQPWIYPALIAYSNLFYSNKKIPGDRQLTPKNNSIH